MATADLPPIRFHDLRHSAATILRANGVDLKTIQAILRHSNLATTADLYAHLYAKEHQAAADRMDDLFSTE